MKKYLIIAEDDEDDRFLAKEAMNANKSLMDVKFMNDGEQLMEFLQLESNYEFLPSLILLDLNMPKLDGRECLKLIKNNPVLKSIPVVVFTTSNLKEDILSTYKLGVNSFINKPVEFEDLKSLFGKLDDYWFGTVKLPA